MLSHSHRAHIQTPDESVDVVLVLRIPHDEDDNPQATLGGVSISLEAQVVNAHISDRDGSPASEVIYSGAVDGSQDPAIIIHSSLDSGASSDEDTVSYSYAVWKKSVFLNRPRIRLQSPSAVFVATASLRSATSPPSDEPRDNYVPSGTAASLNLLESFGSDPALDGIVPRLSALRVSRVTPLTQQANDLVRPLNVAVKAFTTDIPSRTLAHKVHTSKYCPSHSYRDCYARD